MAKKKGSTHTGAPAAQGGEPHKTHGVTARKAHVAKRRAQPRKKRGR